MARSTASTADVARAAPAGEAPPAAVRAAGAQAHVLVVSGLSGAGKSQASKLFEDLGYYCIDNLPPALLDAFLALRDAEPDHYRRVCLVLDIRAGDPAPAIQRAAAALRGRGVPIEVIFLEADDASLVSRFSETRHRHPLEGEQPGVQAGIAEERRRLASTRVLADHVVDTTGLSIGQLKERLFGLIPPDRAIGTLKVDVTSFAYKRGIPLEADLVFDVRFLANPYWQPELKPLSGLDPAVRDYVLHQPAAARFLDMLVELLSLSVPGYRAEGKERLSVALGCTGGVHRSIALAEALAERIRDLPGVTVAVIHRELER